MSHSDRFTESSPQSSTPPPREYPSRAPGHQGVPAAPLNPISHIEHLLPSNLSSNKRAVIQRLLVLELERTARR